MSRLSSRIILLLWRDDFGVVRLDHDFGAKWHFYTTYRYYHQARATGNQIDITGGNARIDCRSPVGAVVLHRQLKYQHHHQPDQRLPLQLPAQLVGPCFPGRPPASAGLGGALEPEGESSTNVLAPINLDTQDVRTRFWDGKDHMIRDDVSWLKGTHFFTFGGLYQRNWNYHQRTDNGGGINYQTCLLARCGLGSVRASNGMDMTGYVPAGVSSRWIREYGIILGVPGVDSDCLHSHRPTAQR